MKRKFPLIIFIVGALILSYPFYSQAFNSLYDSYNVSRYLKSNRRDFEAIREQIKRDNDALVFNAGDDPFGDLGGVWDDALFAEHFIGEVVIPKINLSIPLFNTTSSALLERGATVLNGTSQPLGAVDSHSVITAHRGLPNRELFTNITKLGIGDTFIVSSYGENLVYKVGRIEVVEPHETESLIIESGMDIVTLLTCTPYMINSHRLLVSAYRTDDIEDVVAEVAATQNYQLYRSVGIMGAVFLVLGGGTFIFVKRSRKNK